MHIIYKLIDEHILVSILNTFLSIESHNQKFRPLFQNRNAARSLLSKVQTPVAKT